MTNDSSSSDASLVRKTLRTMGILTLACVIFVGALSVVAVAVTSRAIQGGGSAPTVEAKETPATVTAKKPLSI